MKFKKLLLSAIACTFLGPVCSQNSCSAMSEKYPSFSNHTSPFTPISGDLFEIILLQKISAFTPVSKDSFEIILPKPPASEVKKRKQTRRPATVNNFLETHGGLDISIQEAKQASPQFYNFSRISVRGFEDKINQEHKAKNHHSQKCRCSNCGWIGFPNCNNAQLTCRNCHRHGIVGDNDKNCFEIFNKNRHTTQFGVCPYSTAENPHFGFINDIRIIRKEKIYPPYEGKRLNELKKDTRTEHCWFYCYDCKKHVAVPLNSLA